MHCWCIAAATKLTSVFFQTPPLIIILILAVFVLYQPLRALAEGWLRAMGPSLRLLARPPALPRLPETNKQPLG